MAWKGYEGLAEGYQGRWQTEDRTQIYVSNHGDDGWDGSEGRPVRSIEKAAMLARAAVREDGRGVTVNLAEGIYYLEQPLVFTPEDSGTARQPVVYRGCGNAVISGGRRIYPRWEQVSGGIYRTAMEKGQSFDQFFVNGKKKILARYPNYDESVRYFQGYSADCLSRERTGRYADPRGGYIHAMHQALWGDMHYRVTGRAEDGQLEYEGGWQNNRPSEMHREIRFIENIFEELDSPEEWYYDGREGYLYYYPPQGEDMAHSVYEVAGLKNLLTLQGTAGEPVRYLVFSGIGFRHAGRTFLEEMEPVFRSDWCIYRGGAVFLEGTEHISFLDCEILEVGGNGIMISRYNRDVLIRGCEIADAGANAILMAGDAGAVRSPLFGYESVHEEGPRDTAPGPAAADYPADCRVEGNLLCRNGRVEKQSAGVSLTVCEEIEIVHNTIWDVPRAGINICDGTWGGHVIEKNAVFHTVRETQDHGAFNSWGRDRYWDYRYDRMEETLRRDPDMPLLDAVKTVIIRDNVFECANGWDIDLDDGSSNYLITGNLCLRGGIKNREGVYRRVVNNVMLHNTFHPHVWFEDSRDVFERNIIFRPYADIGLKGWGESFDHNLLYGEGDGRTAGELREKSGMDSHSLCAGFRFRCGEGEGIRILEEDILDRLGIEQLKVQDCGVTNLRLKAKAPSVFDMLREGGTEGPVAETAWDDAGMLLKPLRGLEEMSATGMYEEKGLLVIRISGESKWRRRGFRERDVILEVDGQEAGSPERWAELSCAEPGRAVVWREQGPRILSWSD